MTISDLKQSLKNTYIKNDYGECRALYVALCLMCGLHENYPPEAYGWPWVYEDSEHMVQHAPFRKFVREKRRLELSDLKEYRKNLD